jgi:hypothetical protein
MREKSNNQSQMFLTSVSGARCICSWKDGAREEKAKKLSTKIDFWGTKPSTY